MKLEVGKYYRNADGEKVGPMRYDFGAWDCLDSSGLFEEDGYSFIGSDPNLIEEWQETPAINNGPDTLDNLNLKVGDVVMFGCRGPFTITTNKNGDINAIHADGERQVVKSSLDPSWTVVSRADNPPKTFGELTDAEKGALLLAHHEGKRIEFLEFGPDVWTDAKRYGFYECDIYRVAPTRVSGTCEVDADGNAILETWEAE